MDEKVKNYIEKQEKFKREILVKAREVFLTTIPNCHETFAWGVAVYDDGKFYLAAMKERVHIGFSIIGLSSEEVKEFEGNGKTMRHIKIHSIKEFDKQQIKRLIKLVHSKTACPPDYKKIVHNYC